jgi:hypothetical protein
MTFLVWLLCVPLYELPQWDSNFPDKKSPDDRLTIPILCSADIKSPRHFQSKLGSQHEAISFFYLFNNVLTPSLKSTFMCFLRFSAGNAGTDFHLPKGYYFCLNTFFLIVSAHSSKTRIVLLSFRGLAHNIRTLFIRG